MSLRLCQIALTGASACYLFLVVLNNLTDYGSNLLFVRHVLSMDTTFPDNALRWRAIESPTVHHIFYGIIILWEAAAMVLIGGGTGKLWRARRSGVPEFQRAKGLANIGLTLALLLWFFAFLGIGGEWFLMWQSEWNGQAAAARMFMVMGIVLIILHQREEPEPAEPAEPETIS